MEHLEQHDLLCMMHTCRTLYNLGMPLILKSIIYHPFGCYGPMYRHLLLADSARFAYITHLACYYAHFPLPASPFEGLFLNFLWFATNIQDLDLKFRPDVAVSDEAAKQIGLLPHLRHLKLRGRIPFSQLHRNLSVPLESLHLYREYPWAPLNVSNSPDGPYYSDPLPFLLPFSDSLKTVTVSLGGTGAPPTFLVAGDGSKFPATQRLYWRSSFPMDTGALASTFPSLIFLDIGFADPFVTAGQHTQRLAHRLRNRAASQWDSDYCLQYLRGNPYDLWTLGMRCRVAHLELLEISQDLPPDSDVLPSLFADTHPVDLKAHFTLPGGILGDGGIHWRAFVHDTIRNVEFVLVVFDRSLRRAQSTLVGFFYYPAGKNPSVHSLALIRRTRCRSSDNISTPDER